MNNVRSEDSVINGVIMGCKNRLRRTGLRILPLSPASFGLPALKVDITPELFLSPVVTFEKEQNEKECLLR